MKKVLFKLCFVATIFGFYSCQDGQKTTRKNTWVKVDTVNNATIPSKSQGFTRSKHGIQSKRTPATGVC